MIEAGHRCAIPTCRYPRVEIAHIIPYSEEKEHKFENLIALCPNCHELFDKDKKIDLKAMQIYKNNLALLNSRYGEYERRLLEYLAQNSYQKIVIPGGREIDLHYFLKDGILKKTGKWGGTPFAGIPTVEEYCLTDKGKMLADNFIKAKNIK